jgi:hypothetical protein
MRSLNARRDLCYTATMSAISTVDNETELIGVFELSRLTGVPRPTLYWMTCHNVIPSVDVTQDWHLRRRFKYRLADVKAALAGRRAARAS